MGDTNWQYDNDETEMKKYLQNGLHFKQLVNEPTHDQGHILDHIYINDQFKSWNTESVYYSDHDIIQLQIPKL